VPQRRATKLVKHIREGQLGEDVPTILRMNPGEKAGEKAGAIS